MDMKALLAILLVLFQGGTAPDKWVCTGASKVPPERELTRFDAEEMRARVERCEIPRLLGMVDAEGHVSVQLVVGEGGHVCCARVVEVEAPGGRKYLRTGALEAVRKWSFKPLVVDGQAKPYTGVLVLFVSSFYKVEVEEHCPKEKRRA
jgi:TonB family protein